MLISKATGSKYFGLRGKTLQRAIGGIAGLGFFLFGYDQGVMGGLLNLKTFREQFETINTVDDTSLHTATIQGTAIAVYELGCMVGALSTIYLGDKLGRRKVIYTGTWIIIIGAIIQTASYHLGQLIVGRVVAGIGNGLITATVPMWQSECARPEDRGLMVMIEGCLISGGIALSYWLDFAFFFVKVGSMDWRFPVAFQILIALIIVAFVLEFPESPRWLVKVGREEDAREVWSALENCGPNDDYINYEIHEVKKNLAAEEQMTSWQTFKLIFTYGERKHFHRACLAFWNQAMQQLTGINLITYYAAKIYQDSLHMDDVVSRALAAANGTEYFMASFIPFWSIERFGRRKLMLFGAIGQACTMGILTGCAWAADPNNKDNRAAGIAACVFLFVFNSFFAIGWLGMTWLYPAEITSLEVRAPVSGISTASNWLFNFTVVMICPVGFNSIQSYTYTIFAAINACMVPVIYFLYPETAGRSLEEIDEIFKESNPATPWDVVGIAARMPKRDHNNYDIESRMGGNSMGEQYPEGEPKPEHEEVPEGYTSETAGENSNSSVEYPDNTTHQ